MVGRSALLALASVAAVVVLVAFAFRGGSDGNPEGGDPDPGRTSQPAGATGTPAAQTTEGQPDAAHVQAVVSAHELATAAGLDILEQGGTAADAAVAVAAALSVVEPWFSSALGGGTWALYYDASTGEVTSLNGVGPTGSLVTVEDFAQRAGSAGIHQSNVPGAWDGWMLWLEHYGRLDLGDVLAPAIRIAREGYEVHPEMAHWLSISEGGIRSRETTAAIYIRDGALLQLGDTVFQHEMADTFEALVAAYDERLADGRSAAIQAARDYYYRGPLAEAIVAVSDEHGGYLTLEDFHGFEAEILEPISIDYSDEVRVFQNPPNSQGITMLLALNVLKDYDLGGLGPDDPDALHLQVEAVKLAFADRHYHVGDPDRIDVPVAALLSDAHAASQRARIDMNNALTWPIEDGLGETDSGTSAASAAEAAHTTTFHIVDAAGNGAAVTTSLGAQFYVIGDTGIHINNRMRMMALEDGDPNQVAPGFKVRHTSNPYLALRDGRLYILGGNTGVDTQPQGQMQQFLHIVEFGLGAQEAIDRPRFIASSWPATTYPYNVQGTLDVEQGFPAATIAELRARGHAVQADGSPIVGSANVIVLALDGSDADVGAESRSPVASGTVIRPE